MASITGAINQANNEFNQALSKQKGSTLDKDSFMLLLVTQFKYQDPLNPMDDKEFIAQMAQFSSLEQLMNMNEGMEKLTTATNNQQMVNATSYIGKLVSVTGNSIGKVTTKNADGQDEMSVSTFRYAFGDDVVKGTLTIRDASGSTIYTEDLAGKQKGTTFEFNWSGLNGAGQVAPDGVYTITLAAYNKAGEAVLSDQVVDATVTGVVNQDGTVMLGMEGGQLMELSKVRQVTTPKTKVVADAGDKEEEKPEESDKTEGEGSDTPPVDNSNPTTPDAGGNNDDTTGDGNSGSGNNDGTETEVENNPANNGVKDESTNVAPLG